MLLQAYIVVIFVRVILSWFPIAPDSPFAAVYRFVYALTEPVLGPIRRVMPGVGVGGVGSVVVGVAGVVDWVACAVVCVSVAAL